MSRVSKATKKLLKKVKDGQEEKKKNEKHTEAHVIMYTDGSCKGTAGGWAVSMRSGNHTYYSAGACPDTTNNRMEILAVIKACEKLTVPCLIDLFSDSMYVLRGLTEYSYQWERRDWKSKEGSPIANADLWKRLIIFRDYHTFRVHWVKGHSGVEENEVCDSLAKYARDIEEYDA